MFVTLFGKIPFWKTIIKINPTVKLSYTIVRRVDSLESCTVRVSLYRHEKWFPCEKWDLRKSENSCFSFSGHPKFRNHVNFHMNFTWAKKSPCEIHVKIHMISKFLVTRNESSRMWNRLKSSENSKAVREKLFFDWTICCLEESEIHVNFGIS